jgi:hypothetical protein
MRLEESEGKAEEEGGNEKEDDDNSSSSSSTSFALKVIDPVFVNNIDLNT